jgi:FKBP-type peptidyl-prolyl cis-trans isomerase (trigger factor)
MAELNKVKSLIKKDADGTITLTITLPVAEVTKAKEEEIKEFTKSATLPGFRPGKAPEKMVKEALDPEKVREAVLKKLLPKAYIEAVKEHNLNPIINPKIHVQKFQEGNDWEFTAITCETPVVNLHDYKKEVKGINAKGKIVIPGKEQQKPNFDDVVKAVLTNITVTIPKILIEGEVERLLSQLLSEIKSLGLSLEQYLSSTNKTVDSLKNEYTTKAENDIKFEFTLQKIAEEEKITVDQKEIDEAVQKAKDEKERKQLQSNIYLLATILRQQKTLDYLKNL